MMKEKWILWEDEKFKVITPQNPHIPLKEGLHVKVLPKTEVISAWQDVDLCAETFKLAAKVCQIMKKLKLAPWFNLQANGNWGLLPGKTSRFHVHVYARRKGKTWGMSLQLPLIPGTFKNPPMTEKERERLSQALKENL